MPNQDSTCWTLLREAAAGGEEPRAEFVKRYEPVVRAYLAARWRGSGLLQELDDAVAGDLHRVPAERRRAGSRAGRPAGGVPRLPLRRGAECGAAGRGAPGTTGSPASRQTSRRIPSDEDSLSRVFDRAWAKAVVREAAERQAALAAGRGEAAVRRVELLRLRFHEGMPIREIARLWGVDAAVLHHEYDPGTPGVPRGIAGRRSRPTIPGRPRWSTPSARNSSPCSSDGQSGRESRSGSRAILAVFRESVRENGARGEPVSGE